MPHRATHHPEVKHPVKVPEPAPKVVSEVKTPAPLAAEIRKEAESEVTKAMEVKVSVTPTQVRDMLIHMDESSWRRIRDEVVAALST